MTCSYLTDSFSPIIICFLHFRFNQSENVAAYALSILHTSTNTTLNERQREFPAPPWAGVKRVRSSAPLFLTIGTPYCCLEPTLSASQNPRTHPGIRHGVVRKTTSFVITKIEDFRTTPGLCRALVKGRTPTDTPATAAIDDRCCGGISGVLGCYWFHASLSRDERGRD